MQRSHKKAFQGMLRELDIKNEDDVKSLSQVMAHVFSDGMTNWDWIVTDFFQSLCNQTLKKHKSRKLHWTLSRKYHRCVGQDGTGLASQGSWDGFVEFFQVEDLEGSIRKVLLALQVLLE